MVTFLAVLGAVGWVVVRRRWARWGGFVGFVGMAVSVREALRWCGQSLRARWRVRVVGFFGARSGCVVFIFGITGWGAREEVRNIYLSLSFFWGVC